MKTKIKRHSRAVLSVVLTLCMLVSCMTVGLIATDAAKVTDSAVGAKDSGESVGDTIYYLWFASNNAISNDNDYSSKGAMDAVGDGRYYKAITNFTSYSNFAVFINTDSSTKITGYDSSVTKDTTVTDGNFNSPFNQEFHSGGTAIKAVASSKKTSSTVIYVTYNPTSHAIELSTTAPVSGGGGGESGGGESGGTSGTTALKGNIPVRVLVGTDVMFYICSYASDSMPIDLSSNATNGATLTSTASSKDDITEGKVFYSTTKLSNNKDAYVQITQNQLNTYNRISNNVGNWNGNENVDITSTTPGGGNYWANGGGTGSAPATSCTSTISPDSIVIGGKFTVSTTCGATTVAHGEELYYQYYLDDSTTPIAVDTNKDSIKGSTSAQDFIVSSSITNSLSAGEHTIKTVVTDGNIWYVTEEDTFTILPRLTTPEITIDGSSSSSVTASTTAKSTIKVTNLSSYDEGTLFRLYKGETLKQYNTTGLFTLDRNTDTAGNDYTVVAVPAASDTTHSNSDASTAVELIVTKVAAPTAPELAAAPTVININGNVTMTVGNFASFDTSIYDLKLYKSTSASGTYTEVSGAVFTEASKIIVPSATEGTFYYKVKAVAKDQTVYTDSAYTTTAASVRVVKPWWYTYGNEPFGSTPSGNAWDKTKSHPVNNYYGSDETGDTFFGVYVVDDTNTGTGFRLTSGSSSGYHGYPAGKPTAAPSTPTAVAYMTTTSSDNYWNVPGVGTYFLFIKQNIANAETTKPYLWVRTDLSQVIVNRKYQATYNVATDTYSAIADCSDNSILSTNVDTMVLETGTSYTFTANTGDGYEFVGWYSDADCADNHLLTINQSYTYTAPASSEIKNIYPLVRVKTPQKHTVVVEKNNIATVKATWNGITIANGRNLNNVPQGATVTLSGDAVTGYKFTDIKVKAADGTNVSLTGTKTGTSISNVTFTMPDCDVTVTAVTVEYWGTTTTYTLRKMNSNNPGTGLSNTTTIIDASTSYVYDSGSQAHLYAKIPVTELYDSGYTYLMLVDSAGTICWTGDDQYVTTGVTADSTLYLESRHEEYNSFKAEYTSINLKNSSYKDLIDYILLDITRSADQKTGTYTYSVHFKENSTSTNVAFIAKDGPTRKDISGGSQDNDQMTLGVVGETKVTATSDTTAIGSQTTHATFKNGKTIKYYTGALTKGTTYKIRTNVADNRFYVKAFNVNGVTVSVLGKPASEPSANTEYSCDYTVPNDAPSVLEITPIYYHYNDANCVTFYLEGYDDVIQDDLGWGNTPYIYPYYATQNKDPSGGASGAHNAFGAYAGQPMISTGGVFYTQIPLTDIDLVTGSGSGSETGTNIKGITISNGWYDVIHREIEGWSADDTLHMQTYDYDDFQKIFVEKDPTNIYFEMKLREERDNAQTYRTGNVTTLSSTNISDIGNNGNGWNLLKDKFNRTIDLFGNPLTSAQLSATPLYVISTGYRNNIAGDYGTEWRVYKKDASGIYTLQTANGTRNYAIPPSLLFVNNAENLSNTVYPTNTHTFKVGGTDISAPNDNPSTYSNIYTYLKTNCSGVPVYVSYEENDRSTKSNYGISGEGSTTMYGPYRLDGRWYYTSAGDLIDSNIEIEYVDDAGGFKTDTLTTGYKSKINMGVHTGSYAYFTGEFDGLTQTGDVVLDGTKNFEMYATAGEGYEFVGWYLKNDKSYTSMNPTNKTSSTAATPRNASSTYVARFRKLTSGSLSVSNNNATGTAPDGNTYNGTGKGLVTVWYTINGTAGTPTWTQVGATASADAITVGTDILNDTNIKNGYQTRGSFKLRVTLGNTPDGEDTFALYHNKYTNRTSNTSATTYEVDILDFFSVFTDGETVEYSQNTFTLPFLTYFNQHVYNYTIRYNYRSTRLIDKVNGTGASQAYTVHGTFDATAKSTNIKIVADPDSGENIEVLTDEFIDKVRPTLSNFRKDMDYTVAHLDTSKTTNTTSYSSVVTFINRSNNKVNATLLLPYMVTSREPGSFDFTPQTNASGVVEKNETEGTILVQLNAGYEKFITQNGTATTEVANLLTAPKSLYVDAGTTVHFQYWQVTDPSGAEVVRVYNNEFNYKLFDNYRIEPVYGDTEVTNPNNKAAEDQTAISISYVGTTRNQWNNTNHGGYTIEGNTDANDASDILFNDFELNYAYKNMDVKNDSSIGNIGVVLEKIGTVEYDTNGKAILDMSHYAAKATNTDTYIEAFAKTGSTTGATNPMKKYTVDKSKLNNKNRVEFYYNTYNHYGDTPNDLVVNWKHSYTTYQNVYRAYTYMIVDGEAVISAPAYFTMYGEAV